MHYKRFSGIVLILSAAALMGCGSSVQFVPVDAIVYEARSDNHSIFVYTAQVERPHVVLGTVTVEKKLDAGYGAYSTFDIMVGMLQDKAREVGGDALINIHPVDSKDHLNTTVILVGRVIRYLERQELPIMVR